MLRSAEERQAAAGFQARQAAMFNTHNVPEEFRGWLATLAWEEGHSAGYDCVLNHLDDLIFGLAEPLKAYTKRVTIAE